MPVDRQANDFLVISGVGMACVAVHLGPWNKKHHTSSGYSHLSAMSPLFVSGGDAVYLRGLCFSVLSEKPS
jgi:hypothetical protein